MMPATANQPGGDGFILTESTESALLHMQLAAGLPNLVNYLQFLNIESDRQSYSLPVASCPCSFCDRQKWTDGFFTHKYI